jgi:DNA topoisomerase-2
MIAKEGGILKKFKLQSTFQQSNYVLFSHEGKICRYNNELDILKEFFTLRANLYE